MYDILIEIARPAAVFHNKNSITSSHRFWQKTLQHQLYIFTDTCTRLKTFYYIAISMFTDKVLARRPSIILRYHIYWQCTRSKTFYYIAISMFIDNVLAWRHYYTAISMSNDNELAQRPSIILQYPCLLAIYYPEELLLYCDNPYLMTMYSPEDLLLYCDSLDLTVALDPNDFFQQISTTVNASGQFVSWRRV